MKLVTKLASLLVAGSLASVSLNALAETHVVGQKDSAFTKTELTVKKGDAVDFLNEDPYFHNVFSLSDAKLFDLGSYPEGDSRQVVFDEVGEVEVECAIHPEMRMVINVVE